MTFGPALDILHWFQVDIWKFVFKTQALGHANSLIQTLDGIFQLKSLWEAKFDSLSTLLCGFMLASE